MPQKKGRETKHVMISVVAERFNIHPQTVRMYEREGLLTPRRSAGNTRLYDRRSIRRLELILNLTRELGVNLAGVEVVLNMRDQIDSLQREVERLRARLREQENERRRGGTYALVRVQKAPLVRTPESPEEGASESPSKGSGQGSGEASEPTRGSSGGDASSGS